MPIYYTEEKKVELEANSKSGVKVLRPIEEFDDEIPCLLTPDEITNFSF